jgi:probable H4MPT-linked C1 transfer pathway protein
MLPSVLGLDIGGANLKAAHSDGPARQQPFELWKHPAGLADALRRLIDSMPPADTLAVTMTGELCDCFETKRQGVLAILDTVATVARSRRVRVWRTDGLLVDPGEARATPHLVAAANWLALATFAGRYVPAGPALLIDIGSTTTDVIPLRDGKPVPAGRTDHQRLVGGELVYTGVRRTPLCALLGRLGAAELFATTLDVYLVLGTVPEDPTDHGTADGRPATCAAARARLGRMLCADIETCTPDAIDRLARLARFRQREQIEWGLRLVLERQLARPQTVILAGSGEFLMKGAKSLPWALRGTRVLSLADELGTEVSQAACAHALAVLTREARDAT